MNNKITLEKIGSAGACMHVKMYINNSEVGALYLKEEELNAFLKCLKNGIYSTETELVVNLFDDDDDFDTDEGAEND